MSVPRGASSCCFLFYLPTMQGLDHSQEFSPRGGSSACCSLAGLTLGVDPCVWEGGRFMALSLVLPSWDERCCSGLPCIMHGRGHWVHRCLISYHNIQLGSWGSALGKLVPQSVPYSCSCLGFFFFFPWSGFWSIKSPLNWLWLSGNIASGISSDDKVYAFSRRKRIPMKI